MDSNLVKSLHFYSLKSMEIFVSLCQPPPPPPRRIEVNISRTLYASFKVNHDENIMSSAECDFIIHLKIMF
jgi:hypothetical protein